MTGIVIVNYEKGDILPLQIKLIKKYCKDSAYDIIVVDNSKSFEETTKNYYHATDAGCRYIKTNDSSTGSLSHAFACNVAYETISHDYKYLAFLDHDIFPTKQFSVEKLLQNKIMAALPQERKIDNKVFRYPWPGLTFINNELIHKPDVNFNPVPGLDTGGAMHRIIDKINSDSFVWFNERYEQNPYFNKNKYNFYSMLDNDTWMHFINASNWANANDNTERINSLINILNEKTAQ